MKAQLTINGQTIEVELSAEQLQQLGVEEKRVKKWEDLETIGGLYIDKYENVYRVDNYPTTREHKNIFATENQARSALAAAQLSQLLKRVNGMWKPNWNDVNETKYTIEYMYPGVINVNSRDVTLMFLTVPTFEVAKQFLEDHRALIEEYFLLFQN